MQGAQKLNDKRVTALDEAPGSPDRLSEAREGQIASRDEWEKCYGTGLVRDLQHFRS